MGGKRGRYQMWAGSLLCLAVAGYFALSTAFALWQFELYAAATPHFLRYVAGPGLIALVMAACAFLLRPAARLMLGINALTVLAALFAFELYLTLNSARTETIGQMLGETPARDAERGVIHAFSLGSMNRALETRELPEALLGGIPHARVHLCYDGDRDLYYRSDRLGFNNPDEVYERPIEVALVGDSFVEGYCLPPGEDVVSRLREFIPGTVGLAMRGNGPTLDVAMIARHAEPLQPEHVVIVFFEGNDLRNLGVEMRFSWLDGLTSGDAPEPGPSPAKPATIERARQQALAWQRADVGVVDALSHSATGRNFMALLLTSSTLGLQYGRVPRNFDRLEEVFTKAARLVEGWGGKIHLAYVPTMARFVGILPHAFVYDLTRDGVLEAAREAGLSVIDLTPLFRDKPQPLRMYATDGHFSAEGAKVAAARIAHALGVEAPRRASPTAQRSSDQR